MLRCREISKLVSESMERELSWRQRWQVWTHLMMCRLCAGFARQLRFLRHAARANPERLVADPALPKATLSHESRQRIKAALRVGGNG